LTQALRDGPSDLVLHREDVVQIAVVALGPELVAVGRARQLGRDAQPLAGLADRALHDVLDVETRAS
jgi:hypothetical protein